MQHSRPQTGSPLRASYTPANIDNAKVLTSSMRDPQGRMFASTSASPNARAPGPSTYSFPAAGDREPLLGHTHARETHGGSEIGLAATKSRRKKTGRFGLPVIVICRLFNTIFAICTVDKANKVVEAWNIRANKLVFDFCWIILVWNIFALAISILSCLFFPSSRRVPGDEARRSFRDKLHTQFAINDAALAFITLVLLMIACHIHKNPWDPRLPTDVVAMVSCLVAFEFLIAMIQPFRFSDNMIFTIC
ncbi:hypothetical protein F4821DRAFT_246745 [Hypoxylon rubiginosum]|uniref:Uncharacterized protein n=1 Tax=Hypoxylon rubiginosum TaxID=110542 RepID=A0ACC0CQG1_9PEZI|nr:hypothetical protein F4821DRAFT_246745 [Hypoxylon rubiginosum]